MIKNNSILLIYLIIEYMKGVWLLFRRNEYVMQLNQVTMNKLCKSYSVIYSINDLLQTTLSFK